MRFPSFWVFYGWFFWCLATFLCFGLVLEITSPQSRFIGFGLDPITSHFWDLFWTKWRLTRALKGTSALLGVLNWTDKNFVEKYINTVLKFSNFMTSKCCKLYNFFDKNHWDSLSNILSGYSKWMCTRSTSIVVQFHHSEEHLLKLISGNSKICYLYVSFYNMKSFGRPKIVVFKENLWQIQKIYSTY